MSEHRVAITNAHHEVVAEPFSQITIDDNALPLEATITVIVREGAQVLYRCQAQERVCQRAIRVIMEGVGGLFTGTVHSRTCNAEHASFTTVQHHRASHTTSSFALFGVSADASRAQVHNQIIIDQGLGGVVARQVHKHLLADQGARAVSIPALEVLSDDVQCAHGSAIVNLDQQALFYLQSRGCEPSEAKKILITAFLAQ